MASLLCLLEGLIALAIVSLVLWVLWWAFTSILGVWGVAIAPQIAVLLRVIGVLILVFLIVWALLTGDVCGWWRPESLR